MKTAVYTTIIASGVLCVVLMAAGWMLSGVLVPVDYHSVLLCSFSKTGSRWSSARSRSDGRFMVMTFTDLTLRVLLAIILSGVFGSLGIWMAWPIGWSVATSLSLLFYWKGPWNIREIAGI